MFDVFWVLFGVVVLGGGFFGLRFPLCVCVCVCVCVCARAWLGVTGMTHLRIKSCLYYTEANSAWIFNGASIHADICKL